MLLYGSKFPPLTLAAWYACIGGGKQVVALAIDETSYPQWLWTAREVLAGDYESYVWISMQRSVEDIMSTNFEELSTDPELPVLIEGLLGISMSSNKSKLEEMEVSTVVLTLAA